MMLLWLKVKKKSVRSEHYERRLAFRVFDVVIDRRHWSYHDSSAFGAPSGTVAFLMPDQGSTRYEQHDFPGFKAEMNKLCPDCKVLYQNANADVSQQQQQFNSVISQGAKVIVLDPVDSTAAASLVHLAQSQGVKVIAYDRPVPSTPADYYVSFDNEGIGKAIAQSLVQHLKDTGVPTGQGRRARGQRLAHRRGGGTDQKGYPRRVGGQWLQDARRVRHAGLGAVEGPAVGQRADHPLRRRRLSASWPPTTARAAAAIAAFKAAGVNPVPPVTGNDATLAGLQLIIAGDQYNTILKPSEIVAAAAAKVAVDFLSGQSPKAETTLFNTPSQLFKPAVDHGEESQGGGRRQGVRERQGSVHRPLCRRVQAAGNHELIRRDAGRDPARAGSLYS